MEYRSLGNTGLKVSAIGFGCSQIGTSIFNDINEESSEYILHKAFDSGINFFDTASQYAYGNSEKILGSVFSKKRDQIILATKGGYLDSSLAHYGRYLYPFLKSIRPILKPLERNIKKKTKKRKDFSVLYLRKALERSLKRLNTDYVDLYQLHSPSMDVMRNEEVFHFLDNAQKEGKIRFYGVSVNNPEEAIECLNYPNVSVIQAFCNLVDQDLIHQLFPLLGKRKMGVLIKTPLARGILTADSKIKTGYQIGGPLGLKTKEQLDRIRTYLDGPYTSLPILAIRFLLDQDEVSSILTGTTSVQHLEENLKALKVPSLKDEIDYLKVKTPSSDPMVLDT